MPEADPGIAVPYVITGSGGATKQYNGIHYAEKGGSSGAGYHIGACNPRVSLRYDLGLLKGDCSAVVPPS